MPRFGTGLGARRRRRGRRRGPFHSWWRTGLRPGDAFAWSGLRSVLTSGRALGAGDAFAWSGLRSVLTRGRALGAGDAFAWSGLRSVVARRRALGARVALPRGRPILARRRAGLPILRPPTALARRAFGVGIPPIGDGTLDHAASRRDLGPRAPALLTGGALDAARLRPRLPVERPRVRTVRPRDLGSALSSTRLDRAWRGAGTPIRIRARAAVRPIRSGGRRRPPACHFASRRSLRERFAASLDPRSRLTTDVGKRSAALHARPAGRDIGDAGSGQPAAVDHDRALLDGLKR